MDSNRCGPIDAEVELPTDGAVRIWAVAAYADAEDDEAEGEEDDTAT